MATSPETRYCDRCKQDVTFHYEPVSHVGHLIGTIVTCGLWLPIWLMVTYRPAWVKAKICDKCNETLWGK